MSQAVVFEASWKELDKPKISEHKLPYSDFVTKYPESIYTSARTLGFTRVVAMDKHMNRIAKSLKILINENPDKKKDFLEAYTNLMGNDNYEAFLTESCWKNTFIPWMKEGLAKYKNDIDNKAGKDSGRDEKVKEETETENEPKPKKLKLDSDLGSTSESKPKSEQNHEPKISENSKPVNGIDSGMNSLHEAKISFSISINPLLVRMHITNFLDNNKKDQQILLVKGTRENPTAKHAHWAEVRKPLEALIVPPVNEVVLYEHTTLNCTEGLASNFFVIQKRQHSCDNKPEKLESAVQNTSLSALRDEYMVVTCSTDKVLIGTIMQIVINVCKEDGIEIVYKSPTISELQTDQWEGVFITSTSRLVLPISAAKIYDRENAVLMKKNPLVEHIQRRVLEKVKLESFKVL